MQRLVGNEPVHVYGRAFAQENFHHLLLPRLRRSVKRCIHGSIAAGTIAV